MSPIPTDADGTEGEASSRERRLRYRVLFAEYRTLLLIAFVLLFAVGGWVSYGAYADPGEESDERVETEWTATGTVTHSAVVTESNAVYERGTRLEDEPLYYESVSPVVDAEFAGGYEAASGENVTVELTVDLVYRAVDPDDGTVYWSERERLESVSASDVDPGEPVTATASVNVTDVRNSIGEIESDLEASPGETEIRLDLERRIDGTIAGDERSTNDSYEVAIEGEGATYRLAGPDSYDERHEEVATETVAASPGSLRAVGGPLLAALGLIGAAGVGIATLRLPAPTAAEREWLAYRDDRAEFEEVITTVSLPASALEGSRVDVESLAALARLGIDLETAVLFDPDRGRYVVRDDDLRYVFEPPRPPRDDDVLAPIGDEHAGGAAPTDGSVGASADPPAVADSSDGVTAVDAESVSSPGSDGPRADRTGDPSAGDARTESAAESMTASPSESTDESSATTQRSVAPDLESAAESITDRRAESDADSRTGSDAAPRTESDADPLVESDSDPQTDPVAGSQTATDADRAADSTFELPAEPVDPALEALESGGSDSASAGPGSDPDSDSYPADPLAEPSLEPESAAGIDDDDLLALAGLEPADVSEPELFELDGDRGDPTAPSGDKGDEGDEEKRPDRRSDAGS